MRVIYIILAIAGWVWTAILAWILYVKLRRTPQTVASESAADASTAAAKHDQ